ncbi:MAG TPA: hypothetical protein VM489_04745 [Burkholderiales bacterium]|nr:hypothetical protein [Burkholderiales bacterium]
MPAATVVGIFDNAQSAEKAKDELLEAGVARHRIVVGALPDAEQYGDDIPGSACMVAVVARSHVDKRQIADLLLRSGARGTIEARA